MSRVQLALLVGLSFFSSAIFSENTQSFQLQNGLKIIVREDHRAPAVLCSLWYKVGGAYEPQQDAGISHLLEHWMFEGTQKYKAGVFNKMITEQGGNSNAMTTADYTMYYELLPAKSLSVAFELEADRMHNLVFDPERVEKEKKVVMEERRMRVDDDPRALTYENFQQLAFENKPYAHPVIGYMPDIENLTPNKLRVWYQTYYQPNNAVLIIVGDVDPNKIFALAKQYFGSIPSGKLPVLTRFDTVRISGKRVETMRIPAKSPWLVMGYSVPTYATIAKDQTKTIAALMVTENVLTGSDNAELISDLVHNQKLAVDVNAEYNAYALFPTVFTISAIPTSSNKPLETALINKINQFQNGLISAQVLSRAKAQFISGYVYNQDSLMDQATMLGVPEMAGLSWRVADDVVARVNAVTPSDVQQVASAYFKKDGLTVMLLEPVV